MTDSPARLSLVSLLPITTELKSDDEIAEQAGGNLFTDTPEIRAWLLGVEKGKELVVGGA